jgi:hypothetical protein
MPARDWPGRIPDAGLDQQRPQVAFDETLVRSELGIGGQVQRLHHLSRDIVAVHDLHFAAHEIHIGGRAAVLHARQIREMDLPWVDHQQCG